MNTRWKSLFLAVFSACLLAGSVNARVCFLADLECQKGQSQPVVVDEGEEPCTERYSGETLVLEEDRCSAMEYTNLVCEDSTGYYYKEKGCRAGYIDLEDYAEDGVKNRDKYNCSVVECGRCCLLENTSCPRDYKLCEDPMEPSDNSNNDSCEDKDGNILFKLCECKDEYNIKTQECKRQGLKPGQECGIYTNDCSCPDGYTFVTQNPDPNACPAECDGKGCTRKKQPINVAFPGKKGMCISDEVECKDPPYECNSANGEYTTDDLCKASMLYAVCTLDSNGCWQVTGCETTSLEYGQTLVASRKACYDINNDGCNDNDDNCMEDCNCISDTCEINYVLGEQSRTCEPQFDCATLGYKYCSGDIGEQGTTVGSFYCKAIDNKRYFEGCEVNPALCMNINKNQLGYSEDSGICEIVLPPKESDKWSVREGLVNAEDEGYWKGKTYSENEAEYWLNNGYYWVRPCHIIAGDDILKVRLHECMSEEYDCGGSFSIVYDSTPDNEENAFPGWKTADVDDSSMANGKRCLNLTQNGEQIMFGTTLDGTRVECGGKEYITDCKCTTFNAGKPEGCEIRILEAPLSKSGIRIPTLKIEAGDVVHCNNETGKCGSDETGDLQVFTGELVPGCANAQEGPAFTLVYAYFRAPDSNEKCLSSASIDEMTDFCTGEEVCVGTVLSESEAGIRCDGKCGTEDKCEEGYICTESTFYNERSACTGECVPAACPSGQVCKEATIIDDVGGIRKYCKPENCMEEPKTKCNSYDGKYCEKAIDPITEKEYCASDCINGCEEYVKDLQNAGKEVEYYKRSATCMISTGSSWVNFESRYITLDTGVGCYIFQNCEKTIDPNSPCADYFTEQDLPPSGYKVCGYFTPCVKSANCYSECGGHYYFSSGDCCQAKKSDETIYANKASFEDDITRGFTDSTSEHYPNYKDDETFDEKIGCYYTKCEGSKLSSNGIERCCPKVKEGHILSGQTPGENVINVTSEYGEVPEGCFYYKTKSVPCEEYTECGGKYFTEDPTEGGVKTLSDVGLSEYFYMEYAHYGSSPKTETSCYAYAPCSIEKCFHYTSPITGAKTAEELNCPTGQEPDQNGLISECGGKYYKEGTQCVCPDKEDQGYYQNKTAGSEYYYAGSMGIEGCEYYAKCTTPDGYVTEAECKNKGKDVPTGGNTISRCNTTYYQGSCVCPDLSDKGCYLEGTSGVTYPVTGTIPDVSSDCKYVARCDTKTKNCAGGSSPLVDEDGNLPTAPISQDTCEELGGQVKPEEMIKSTSDGTCGGPLYTECHLQTQ